MRVGLRLSYRPSDLGRAALKLADCLQGLGHRVCLASTDRVQPFCPRWDRRVHVGPRRAPWDVDVEIHMAPRVEVSNWGAVQVAILCGRTADPALELVDRVVYHYESLRSVLSPGHPPAERIPWGWSGPIGTPLGGWESKRVLYPLLGHQAARAGPGVLLQVRKILSGDARTSVELWLGGGWDSTAFRRLRRLQADYPRRFEVLADRDLPVGGLGERYRRAALVVWPVAEDAFGEIPAQAEMAGTPIATRFGAALPSSPDGVGGRRLRLGNEEGVGDEVLEILNSKPKFVYSREELFRRAERRELRFRERWKNLLSSIP